MQEETEPTRLRVIGRVEVAAEWKNRAVVSLDLGGDRVLIPTPNGSLGAIQAALPVIGLWLTGYSGDLLSTGSGAIYAYRVECAGGEGDLPRQGWYLVDYTAADLKNT